MVATATLNLTRPEGTTGKLADVVAICMPIRDCMRPTGTVGFVAEVEPTQVEMPVTLILPSGSPDRTPLSAMPQTQIWPLYFPVTRRQDNAADINRGAGNHAATASRRRSASIVTDLNSPTMVPGGASLPSITAGGGTPGGPYLDQQFQ